MLARLSIVRGVPAAARPHVRGMCVAAADLPTQIDDMLTKLKSPVPVPGDYTIDGFKKALESGTLETSKVATHFTWNDEAKKLAMKMVSDINKQANDKRSLDIDWASWNEKITSPGVVDAIKKAYEEETEDILKAHDIDKMFAADEAEVKAIFKELGEQASKDAKEADAGIAKLIGELEVLQKQIGSIRTQTIAEVLEQEPEMRKEIEEELANNVWAP